MLDGFVWILCPNPHPRSHHLPSHKAKVQSPWFKDTGLGNGFSLRKEAHATERLGGIRSRSALLTSAYPWVLVGVFNAVDLDRRFTLLNAINLLIKVHMALHKA